MSNSHSEGISSRLLKFIDLFGLEPKIKIQNKEKYNTIFGGLISIFVSIAILMGFIYFGQELIVKKNPTVMLSNQYDTEPQRYNLTRNKFNFVFGMEDQNSQLYVDFSIFYARAKMDIITRSVNANGVPTIVFDHVYLRVEICNKDRHFPYFFDLFSAIDLGKSMCIHPDDAELLYIQGMWGSSHYTAVSLDIMPCTNSTDSSIICKPQEQIDKQLSGGYFNVYIIDTIFDPTNYTQPYTYIARNFYTSISKNFFKLFELYFKNVDYTTDSGALVQNESTERYLQLDYTHEMFDFRGTPQFFSFLLRTSNNRDIFTRKYIKIQDILANMGGLIKGIMLGVYIIFFLFRSTNFYVFLIEKIYASYFVGNVVGKGVAIQLPNASQSMVGNNLVNNFLNDKTLTQHDTNILAMKMRNLETERKKQALSLRDVITIPFSTCCGKKGKSFNIYRYGKAKIDSNTDFIKLYNLTEELELLKAIMFPEAGLRMLLDFLMENKVLSVTPNHEKISVDEVYNNYKDLPSDGLNMSLKNVFEKQVNILLNKTGNTLA
jgi:hypothetical protein